MENEEQLREEKPANTFGDYQFEDWVPEHTREIIRSFWGCMGRTFEDWLRNPNSGCEVREMSHHGPNPNGFGCPPNGARAEYFLRIPRTDTYKIVEGRYLHRWNNLGSLIDDKGIDHTVSSCDRWVRVWQTEEEKKQALLQAELRWLTAQIERLQEAYGEDGKPALVIIESLEGCVEQRPALQEVLAPLIERKKELEAIIGKEDGV